MSSLLLSGLAALKTIYQDRYQILVQTLVEARKQLKFTQAEVAQQLNKPQSYIAKIEGKDRKLDVLEFIELCKILHLDAQKIIEKLQGMK